MDTTNTEEQPKTTLEVVDLEEDTTETSSATNAGMSLINIESTIHRYLSDMEKLRTQYKSQKEMHDAAFENDAEYSEQAEKEKVIKKAKAAIKEKIVKQPGVSVAIQRMNELKSEMKDVQDTITAYLQQYQEISGSNQFMGENGEVLEIVKVVKLVKRK